jgi:hypothetical protein
MIDLDDMQQASITTNTTAEGNVARGGVISSKINHLHTFSPFTSCNARVMQDKGITNFIAGICTTPLNPPVMCWRDMYFIYIYLWQYIAPMYRYLLY